MAERKIVEVEETKSDSKKQGLNIDLSELKKIGAAILAFVVSNPEIASKLLEKPATYLKKIVNGESVSKDTKKKVNKTIKDSESGGLSSIFTSLTSMSNGDKETNDLFGKISNTIKGAAVAKTAGSLIGELSGSSSKTKKTTKSKSKSNGSSDLLGGIIKGLFK